LSVPFPADDFPGERIDADKQGRARWLLDGYVLIHEPAHPLASQKHGTVLEHRMVLYDAGTDPRGWHVHHCNRDRRDNSIGNLELRDPTEHGRMHARQRWDAVAQHGNAATPDAPGLTTVG
jgi:hypothetical protein